MMGSNLTLQKRFWCQCGYFSVNSRSLLTAEKKKKDKLYAKNYQERN